MANNENSIGCTATSWGLAALGGLVIGAVMFVVADWSISAAIFLAIAIAVIVGLFLSLVICSGAKGTTTPAAAPAPGAAKTAPAPAAAAPTAAASAAAEPAASTSTAPPSATIKPSAALAGQAELSARKGTWKYEKDDPTLPAKGASAAPTPVAAEDAPKGKRAPVAADGEPELMVTPRPEGPDDLKLISGVGPKLEQTLNEMGIWHFSQVAGWRKKEIAWVDERLRFKGRIERDDWMSQAKILAKGGETEFSKKKKK